MSTTSLPALRILSLLIIMPPGGYVPNNGDFDYHYGAGRMRRCCLLFVGEPVPYHLSVCLARAVRAFRNCLDSLTEEVMYYYYIDWCYARCTTVRRCCGPPPGSRRWDQFAYDQRGLAGEIWEEVAEEVQLREALRRARRHRHR